MKLLRNLVHNIERDGYTLSDILHAQHWYHENRRWSVKELLERDWVKNVTRRDRAFTWHAARAEITTQPAGLRMALEGVRRAQELESSNPTGAMVLHAAAAWSARYWMEEESHHEVAFAALADWCGMEPVPQDEVVAHRGFFPDDNYVRICVLQACVEIEAVVGYSHIARVATDPLVREVFKRVMQDESQHRLYFFAFAKALIDSGVHAIKDALSMAYLWIRPGGETYGSKRERQEEREGFVNWWEHVVVDPGDDRVLWPDGAEEAALLEKKRDVLLSGISGVTGLNLKSVGQLKRAYLASLTTNDRAAIQERADDAGSVPRQVRATLERPVAANAR